MKKIGIALLMIPMILTGCGQAKQPIKDLHSGPNRPSSSEKGGADWPMFGDNAWQDRLSPIALINAQTVSRLHKAFSVTLPANGGNESFPLEQNGVLYVTTGHGNVFALNAATGKMLWSYLNTHSLPYWMPAINRGVALGKNHVYVLTPDDLLVSINKRTGTLNYAVTVADSTKGIFESMAPLWANGEVVVGSSGGDEGIRGFVSAYQAATGKRLWQFYTVPARGQAWMAATGSHGGGAVWTTPSYDPSSNSIFVGTGNPSPDYFGKTRLGPNPYTDSVLRMNLARGTLLWARQEVPHDLWDYDVASPPILFYRSGQLTVGEAGKDGYWYEWNVQTGQMVIHPVAFVHEHHTPPTSTGTKEWPGPNGGANYGPSAYNPETGDAYVAGINGPEILYAGPATHQGFGLDLGTGQAPAPAGDWTGTITAIQVKSGQIAWQIPTPTPPIGGVTVNAGGLVWFGLQDGTLNAVSASTGKWIWRVKTGAPIGSAPILYKWRGHDYVAVMTGGAGSLAGLFPYYGPSRLVVYRLS